MLRRTIACWAILAILAAASGCLFSTTPPERTTPVGPAPVPGEAVVTGLVQHVDARDNHVRNVAGRVVLARWYKYRTSDRAYIMLRATTAVSGNGGTYRVAIIDPEVAAVKVAALRCDLSPQDANLDDCLTDPPSPLCNTWTSPIFVSIAPNGRAQQHLKVPCVAVP